MFEPWTHRDEICEARHRLAKALRSRT